MFVWQSVQAFDELQKASDEAEAREEGDPIGIGHQFDRLFETWTGFDLDWIGM